MQIAPSFLSCDFSKMGEELMRMDKAGADLIHLDVMDGHFVPNITFGAPVIKWARPYTKLPFDVHLMISEPHRYIQDFVQAGADIITFHVECDSNIDETISLIEKSGVKPGLVIKPNTPASSVFPYMDRLYMVPLSIPLFTLRRLLLVATCKIPSSRKAPVMTFWLLLNSKPTSLPPLATRFC